MYHLQRLAFVLRKFGLFILKYFLFSFILFVIGMTIFSYRTLHHSIDFDKVDSKQVEFESDNTVHIPDDIQYIKELYLSRSSLISLLWLTDPMFTFFGFGYPDSYYSWSSVWFPNVHFFYNLYFSRSYDPRYLLTVKMKGPIKTGSYTKITPYILEDDCYTFNSLNISRSGSAESGLSLEFANAKQDNAESYLKLKHRHILPRFHLPHIKVPSLMNACNMLMDNMDEIIIYKYRDKAITGSPMSGLKPATIKPSETTFTMYFKNGIQFIFEASKTYQKY